MAYDAEIRVKTKIDNSDVIKLEASVESAEKKAEDLGDTLDQVTLNKEVAETAQQASENMDALAQKTKKAASEAEKLDAAFKNTKIHLVDGTTLDWDGNVIEEAIRDTEELEHRQSRLSDVAQKNIEPMRQLAEETQRVNDAARGLEAVPVDSMEKELTPMQNTLAFIKKSFQDIPILFGGIANKVTGKTRQMEDGWDNLSNKVSAYRNILKDLERDDKGFGDKEYDEAYIQLQKAEQAVKSYKDQLVSSKKQQINLGAGLQKIGKSVSGIFRKMGSAAKKFFSSTQKEAKKTNGILGTMASRMKGLLLSLLIFNWISKGFNAMVSGMKKGFDNLMKYSESYRNSVMSLRNAMSTLGNAFAGAFAPIVQAAIPYLIQLINWINQAINAVAQLFAYLSGKSTWIKATQVQNGYNDSLNGTADAAKKAAGALAKFDDLDVLQKQEVPNAGGSGAAGGGFEEVPIENDIKKFADKIKDILSKLFAPLKKAWEREGKFVMDSWKYALDECWKLIKDIGRDFLTMWNQEATISMFADVLHILGDIGLIIGNLAHNIRDAWNENNAGLRILESIRDIFQVIIYNIRQAADATVEWSKKLDFKPLFESFAQYVDSLVPVIGTLSGILSDFYTQVLLPLGKWTIEKGLPELLDIFTDFNEKVNWGAIRQELSDLWAHLEPFAETVGEGLLIFLRSISDLVADFINSDKVTDFLDKLKEWMDSVEPEDVAEAIKDLAESFLKLRLSILLLDAAIAGCKIVTTLAGIAGGIKTVAKGIISFFKGINFAQIFNNMGPGMQGHLAMTIADFVKGSILDPITWDNWIGDLVRHFAGLWARFWDGVGEVLAHPVATFMDGLAAIFDLSWVQDLFENAKKNFVDAFNGEDVGLNIVKGLFNGISAAMGLFLAPIVNVFKNIVLGVLELFGIHSPSTVFAEIGTCIILGLLGGLQETWNKVMEWWNSSAIVVWWTESVMPWFTAEKWMELFQNIRLALETKWAELVEWWQNIALFTWWEENVVPWFSQEKWLELLENIRLAFETKWIEVKEKTVELLEEMKKSIQEKMDKIREKFDEVGKKLDEFKNKSKTVFESVKNKVEEYMTPVINKIQSFIDKIRDAIQAVKEFLESGFDKIGGFVGGIFSGGSGTRQAAPKAAPTSAMLTQAIDNIPHLASGAVIRGGNPFMAVLGDQRPGQTNIEAPLSTIRQALREEFSSMNFGGQLKVVLQVNGTDLAQATLQDFLSEMNRQGLDVEVLGVT